MIAALFLITRSGGPVSAAPFTVRDRIIGLAVIIAVAIAFDLLSRAITPKNTRR